MSNKNFRPVTGQPKPLTEEQKRAKAFDFIMQSRERYALAILANLCQGVDKITEEKGKALVHTSVVMADELLSELYPVNEKTEDPVND